MPRLCRYASRNPNPDALGIGNNSATALQNSRSAAAVRRCQTMTGRPPKERFHLAGRSGNALLRHSGLRQGPIPIGAFVRRLNAQLGEPCEQEQWR